MSPMPQEQKGTQRDIDAEVQQSMTLLGRLKLISESKIKLWRALLITVFIAGFVAALVWVISEEYYSRSGAQTPQQITNQASVSFTDSSGNAQPVVQSNVVVTSLSADVVNINITKEGRTLNGQNNDQSGQVAMRFFSPNSSNQIAEFTGQVNTSGDGSIQVSPQYFGQSYDVVIKAPGYLSRRQASVNISTNTIFFQVLKAGDFVEDDVVNSIDFGLMNSNWGPSPSNPIVDINGDAQVNTLDFSILSANWFVQGEDPSL